ncbi:MAG TPA: NAD-dependent epimerase/dehydratase family protein [Gaiellaceae bacterium]|nr:NAD-dependent epimerase/dehydratase family protein [Gaiellaceae bacterium]
MRDGQRVAVVGAGGFVGQAVLNLLQEQGVHAVAVVRGDPAIADRSGFHRVVPTLGALAGAQVDALLNLAYPTRGEAETHRSQTEQLFADIGRAVVPGGRVIHASTLAVFGLALDRVVDVGPVRRQRDVPYVEAKIAAEHAAARIQSRGGLSLDIVRLGNVTGRSSPIWAQQFVHRLLTGRPVGVRGVTGVSNATDVANAASYLTWLLLGSPQTGIRYHHLAEFSAAPWSSWIDPMASVLGVEPVLAERGGPQPLSVRDELSRAFAGFGPRRVYRTLRRERVMGSWMRSLRAHTPYRLVPRSASADMVFAPPVSYARGEQDFLATMAAQQEFRSVTDPRWTPSIDLPESVNRLVEWLAQDWRLPAR